MAKFLNRHSSKSIWVIKLTFSQNDCSMGGSFWPKASLITHILFELWLFHALWPSVLYFCSPSTMFLGYYHNKIQKILIYFFWITQIIIVSYCQFIFIICCGINHSIHCERAQHSGTDFCKKENIFDQSLKLFSFTRFLSECNKICLKNCLKKFSQLCYKYLSPVNIRGAKTLFELHQKCFSNFSCMFLNPNNFFQFDIELF